MLLFLSSLSLADYGILSYLYALQQNSWDHSFLCESAYSSAYTESFSSGEPNLPCALFLGGPLSSLEHDFQGCLLTKKSTINFKKISDRSALLSTLLSVFGSNGLVCSCTNNMGNLKDLYVIQCRLEKVDPLRFCSKECALLQQRPQLWSALNQNWALLGFLKII